MPFLKSRRAFAGSLGEAAALLAALPEIVPAPSAAA